MFGCLGCLPWENLGEMWVCHYVLEPLGALRIFKLKRPSPHVNILPKKKSLFKLIIQMFDHAEDDDYIIACMLL